MNAARGEVRSAVSSQRTSWVATRSGVFAALLVVVLGKQTSAQHVHVLLAADTVDETACCIPDLINMYHTFYKNTPKDVATIRVLYGRDVQRSNFESEIRAMPVASSDAVVVYYAGHGAYDSDRAAGERGAKSGDGHFLSLPSRERLYRPMLREWISEKKPRLAVLITDTCSAFTSSAPPSVAELQAVIPRAIVNSCG